MGKSRHSSAQISVPLEGSLGCVVLGPVRSYIRIHHLSRAVAEYILQRVERAVCRLSGKKTPRSARARLTMRIQDGRLEVILRLFSPDPWDLRLAPLTRGAPRGVRAGYRAGRRGGTLTFSSPIKRKA